MQPDYLKDKITEDSVIACYMTDRHRHLRPDAFLDVAQHMAVVGADTLKFGDDGCDQYASLLGAGAFDEFTSERIFEDKDKGMLA